MPPEAGPPSDPCPAVLRCAVRWLSGSGMSSLSLDSLLAELAEGFGVSGVGVAQLPGGEPIAGQLANGLLPWRERPDLVREVLLSPTALSVRDGKTHWLLTGVGADESLGWLLWLEAPETREWSPPEAATLALAGDALGRHLRRPGEAPHWARQLLARRRQQRFDDAATAARRIAHDYGNVLTGILGFSELALAQVPRGSLSAGYLAEVHNAGQQGERLTSRLRLFARRSWPRNQPASLTSVASDEVRRLRGQFPTARLEVALPADLPAVAIDPDPLRHLLGQLLDNAAEAVATRGTICLSAQVVALTADQCLDLLGAAAPGPYVEVAVEDTGCGLSAEARQLLLTEPFFTTKPRQRGYGVAVAYGILTAHKGALAVDPTGAGTVARIYLPVASEPVFESSLAASSTMPHKRVLVVDDDPMILQLVQTTLRRAGYRVETAMTAADAFRSYTRTSDRFGLVLADVVMPHVSGYDLARQLCAHDAGVNVLFMTGQVVPDAARPTTTRSACDLLTKPFGPEGLLRAVRCALERGSHRQTTDGTGGEGIRSSAP
jgi:signal transduction histidine kinase/ActR/RegA family two-component response regulator